MIFLQIKEQLQMLNDVLLKLDDEQFIQPIKHLNGATVGQHSRHIIELLNCALQAKKTGVVDYVNRTRNLLLETDRSLAVQLLQQLLLLEETEDSRLVLQTNVAPADTDTTCVSTTFYREIVYNTEHITHHLALIKVALIELDIHINNPSFGYAYATLQYQQQLVAQNG